MRTRMTIKYILSKSIDALDKNNAVTEIPKGELVEGTVNVRCKDRLMTVLALDFLDSARIDAG